MAGGKHYCKRHPDLMRTMERQPDPITVRYSAKTYCRPDAIERWNETQAAAGNQVRGCRIAVASSMFGLPDHQMHRRRLRAHQSASNVGHEHLRPDRGLPR